MLNIIYAALAVSIAVSPTEPNSSFKNWSTFIEIQRPDAALTSQMLPTAEQIVEDRRLAKGRRYESDYRNEADRARERHQNHREYYRYDPYEVEYDRDGRGRIHRDAEQRRREENLESEQPNRHRRSRDRDRDRHRSIYYWRQR